MAVRVRGLGAVRRELNNSIKDTIDELADITLNAAKDSTPVRTGFTKRQWTKRESAKNFEVANRVPWIERLEAGSSRKAPRGIIGPTLSTVRRKT